MKTVLLFSDGTAGKAASLCRRLEEQGGRIFATDQLAEACQALEGPEIDLVIINTPSGSGTAKMVAEAAGAAGVRVFVLLHTL